MENQEIMEQFMENRQNYMMDNNMQHMQNNETAGCENVVNVGGGGVAENLSVGGGVGGVVGVGGEILGVKYDEQLQHHEEHDVGDDDEWKYVKEVQQSEKQQQQQQQQSLKNFGLGDVDDGGYDNTNELADNEIAKGGSHEFGNGEREFVFGGDHHHQAVQQEQHHDLFNLGNGHDTNGHEIHQNLEISANDEFEKIASEAFDGKNPFDNDVIDPFKAEGDFSYTSNNTESVEEFVPQIDVKIETKSELLQEPQELGDEEEPSSLATNTTNGTSSLSENVPQQASSVPAAVASATANAFDDFMATLENKENSDPLTPQRPDALDIDQAQSILNPDAKEFIPSFGSNPASPTSPFGSGMQSSDFGEPMETQMYFGQQPSAVPRHLLAGDDDFVAQSPRKGRGDNMDIVSLPKELAEFEEEADKRPHELEPDDVDILQNRDGVMTPDQQIQPLPLDDIVNEKENQDPSKPEDITDFQPSSFMDHGPETCVDLDADIDITAAVVLSSLNAEDDVMKRSIYVANDETATIEDVLNSVQPIPTEIDSVNNSFIEESATESAAATAADAAIANQTNDKELLQVEEKEHVSHSPSTEEIQMNLQNTLNSSNKDIPQLPIDMDNANNMQESMYEPQEQLHEDSQLQQFEQLEEELHQQQHEHHEEMLHQQQYQHREEELHQQQHEHHEEESHQQQQQHLYDEPQQQIETMNVDEIADESILADTTNPLIAADDSLLNNSFEAQQEPLQQQQQEIQETLEQIVSQAVTSTPTLNFDMQETEASSDILTPSYTTDEKHLLEETKEQHSISALEQQMNEMILNNDDHLSQVEEVAVSPAGATTVIDDISEHLISPDVAVNEVEQSPEQKMLVDESFNAALEEDYLRTHEQPEPIGVPVQEFIESPIENQQLENEMVAVEEPMFEAKKATPLFNTEETEIANDSQHHHHHEQHEEVKEELPPCMVPETAPAEYLEPPPCMVPETAPAEFLEPPTPMDSETEIIKKEEVVEKTDVAMEVLEEPKIQEDEVKVENVSAVEEVKDNSIPIAAAAAVAATAAAATVGTKLVSSATKKTESAKKPLAKTSTGTTGLAKPKATGISATAAKKPLETAKKPISSVAAKPRVTPAKPATTTSASSAEKKPLTKTTTTTTAARKPLSAGTTMAPKPAVKTTTTTSTTRTTARPTTTTTTRTTTSARPMTTTTLTRKPLASAATNGPVAKPRPATAPAKPTSLGLPTTNGAAKTKVTSPRATLTSQLRKTAPTSSSTTTTTAAAKSPVKTTATNGVAKSAAASTLASRTKATTTTASHTTTSSHGTKPFTARPAPKFTTSSSSTTTTTTTRRLTVGGTTTGSTTTTTTTKTGTGAPLRKSSPSKPLAGRTPTKTTTTGGLKGKTPQTKKESPPEKRPAPIRKPIDKTITTNGDANISKELNGEQQPPQNGDLQQTVQQNGDSNIIPMQSGDGVLQQHQHQPLLEQRDEQIPMDLINA